MTSRNEFSKAWSRLIAASWRDDDLADRLVHDPAAVLQEAGVEIPEGRTVRVHHNSEHVINLVIPTKPPRELADTDTVNSSDNGYFYTLF
jgi:Nitrile hydratase, alpha chain